MSVVRSIDAIAVPKRAAPPQNPWAFSYPNTADFNFNYWRLLSEAAGAHGIATATNPQLRIAIVGAGIAGLTAARELYRCGYTHVDLYEATDRIGGRTYSIPITTDGRLVQYTTYEMGAMRMPFFPPTTESTFPGTRNSVLDYYVAEFGIAVQPFPDPGSPNVTATGIYVNGGLGPDPNAPNPRPTLEIWKNPHGKSAPPPNYRQVYNKWGAFVDVFTGVVRHYYAEPSTWPAFWQNIVAHYWNMTFREFAVAPAISYDPANPGAFGGLGMTQAEAWIFYVIGAGDGGWGAFFDVSVLYPIRTLLFGFATKHQLVRGYFSNEEYVPGPHAHDSIADSNGCPLSPPYDLGLQSLAESLFYVSFEGAAESLYSSMRPADANGFHLYTRTPVSELARQTDGTIVLSTAVGAARSYDAVIVTTPTWTLEMSCSLSGFDQTALPYNARLAINESHWIASTKVFFPLAKSYWLDTAVSRAIPQVINTDTFLQDVYGIASGDDPGIVLISYTWEDDSIKLESTVDDTMLANQCLAKLDAILQQTGYPPMSNYVDTTLPPVVIRWQREPTYRGCAKLYREMSWTIDYALLSYNQDHSAKSNLYFAGEGYSVEGGWTEPALRLALDAVINLAVNTGATFNAGFNPKIDYPRYSSWDPGADPPPSAPSLPQGVELRR